MYPIIDLGIIEISSYAIMVLVGMIGYTVITINLLEKKEKYETKTVNKLLVLSIFCFIILYVSAFIMNSIFHSIGEGQLVIGGITWLGGVIVTFPITIILIYIFIPELRGKAIETFSLMVPGIILAHGFGRIGCFLGGCCFGEVTDTFLGIVFPAGSPAATLHPGLNGESLPVLPTQLFEAIFEFILFTIIIILYKKTKNINVEIYGISYGIFRFILEFFRGDDRGGTGVFITPSQLMSIVLIIIVILIILYKKKLILRKTTERFERWIVRKIRNERDKIQQLKDYHELYKNGIISEEEFQEIKNKIIKGI